MQQTELSRAQQPHQARLGVPCPNCHGRARIRTSRGLTPCFRQLYFACLDPECGLTFGGCLEITHIISPSARPNPALQLPSSPPRHRAPAPVEVPMPANDESGPEVPLAPKAVGDG